MKLNMKIITIISLFAIITSMGMAFAADVSVGSSTFEMPDGYELNASSDQMVILVNSTSAIVILESDVESDIETAKKTA